MANETVIDATAKAEWKRKERKKAYIIAAVCGAVFLYTMGAFDVVLFNMGFQGLNFHNCVGTSANVTFCDGPLSTNKPPSGVTLEDMTSFWGE
ncbi:MAG: hypothetical protein IT301_06650 [Dehalococcoidia bacterium]|nr:hypothetical protein [Dehalococcoidia bacterium]